ncbi:DNA repair protein RecO [Candidatus Phycosocius spiralis]|uniref:DNA repair protein RecO n=1 Tax=Candidatus Phycosocius spiralis TaxID=2815099 RepID=A0ABQ4PS75_9PROT|nr:DNA repair protein RecO [Candidatus Phycosocius spiralis]GIU65864.1 DNA repair protein RecO [Candidatus Phycosocius spiralis]
MSEWEGRAIALAARRFGENDAILEVLSDAKGRASGLVYGGSGKRKRAYLEPGTRLHVTWKARSDDQLGFFDPIEARGGGPSDVMDDRAALAALASVASLLLDATPDRQACLGLFEATEILLDSLSDSQSWPALYVRWEMGLLAEMGYGLDLSQCALTGTQDDLAWVSPKTGRAASRQAGEPYQDRLLALPPFLLGGQNRPQSGDIADGFALLGHFIAQALLDPLRKPMPETRARLIFALGKSGRL